MMTPQDTASNLTKTSWSTRIFYLINIVASMMAFTGLAYNFETVFLLIDGNMFLVPMIWAFFCSFFLFNIFFMIRGISSNNTWQYTLVIQLFEGVAWLTNIFFVGVNVCLFYFGEYIETSHEAFILLLFWVNSFVGPFVILSVGFLGLLHYMRNDQMSSVQTLINNGQLAVLVPIQQPLMCQSLSDRTVEYMV